jgi:hypothetical protein
MSCVLQQEAPSGDGVGCAVPAHASVAASREEIDLLRARMGEAFSALSRRALRHASAQAVVGLAAVARAIEAFPTPTPSFAEWGVVAGVRYLARTTALASIQAFQHEGLCSASPHIIPNCSLHAVAGTVSLALPAHGPNYGVGGRDQQVPEGLVTALALVTENRLPGVWLVLTEWDPEEVLDEQGQRSPEARCRGVALALVPGPQVSPGLRLHCQTGPTQKANPERGGTGSMARFLEGLPTSPEREWTCPVTATVTVKLAA